MAIEYHFLQFHLPCAARYFFLFSYIISAAFSSALNQTVTLFHTFRLFWFVNKKCEASTTASQQWFFSRHIVFTSKYPIDCIHIYSLIDQHKWLGYTCFFCSSSSSAKLCSMCVTPTTHFNFISLRPNGFLSNCIMIDRCKCITLRLFFSATFSGDKFISISRNSGWVWAELACVRACMCIFDRRNWMLLVKCVTVTNSSFSSPSFLSNHFSSIFFPLCLCV